jgi:hypothetical protein
MGWEAFSEDFYPTAMPLYIILRYLLIVVTYYMFCKDYKSIAQSLLLFKQFPEIIEDKVMNFSFRMLNVIINECVVFWIIVSSDLGDIGGLGLIINFSSAMLICQLDDILFESARVHNLKENFEELAENPIKKLNKDNHALMAKVEKIRSNLLMLEDGNLNVP